MTPELQALESRRLCRKSPVVVQPIGITAYVWDFDDCLVDTSSAILEYGGFDGFEPFVEESESDWHYGNAVADVTLPRNDVWDLAITAMQWGDSFILSGRNHGQIERWLKKNGRQHGWSCVWGLGILPPEITLAKSDVLRKLTKKYSTVVFYDDNKENIEMAHGIPGVIAHMV